mmetsp:Transcript_40449/g.79739  ORF Transcript_40449/g.79739 Transcript_40449/m.79739 type:complete len:104 (+) Transcript_40449:71-382(+)
MLFFSFSFVRMFVAIDLDGPSSRSANALDKREGVPAGGEGTGKTRKVKQMLSREQKGERGYGSVGLLWRPPSLLCLPSFLSVRLFPRACRSVDFLKERQERSS